MHVHIENAIAYVRINYENTKSPKFLWDLYQVRI